MNKMSKNAIFQTLNNVPYDLVDHVVQMIKPAGLNIQVESSYGQLTWYGQFPQTSCRKIQLDQLIQFSIQFITKVMYIHSHGLAVLFACVMHKMYCQPCSYTNSHSKWWNIVKLIGGSVEITLITVLQNI